MARRHGPAGANDWGWPIPSFAIKSPADPITSSATTIQTGRRFRIMASFRLLTYVRDREPRAGLLVDGTVLDLDSALRAHARSAGKTLAFSGAAVRSVVDNWAKAHPMLNAIARDGAGRGVRSQPIGRTRLLAPIPDVGTI